MIRFLSIHLLSLLHKILSYKWDAGALCTIDMACNATLVGSAGVFIPNTTFILQVGGTDLEGNTYGSMHLIDTAPLQYIPPMEPTLSIPNFRKGDSLESYNPLIDGFTRPVLCSYQNEIILADMSAFGQDLFILNVDEWNWTRLPKSSNERLQLYASTCHDNKLYIHGGIGQNSLSFWSLDLETKSWTSLPNAPFETIWKHVLVGNDQELFIFGGQVARQNGTQTLPFTEIWSYHLQDSTWSQVKTSIPFMGSGTGTFIPSLDSILVYGDPADPSFMKLNKDGWALVQLNVSKEIARITPSSMSIPGRVGHTSLYDPNTDFLVSFGGFIPDQADSSFFSIYFIQTESFLDFSVSMDPISYRMLHASSLLNSSNTLFSNQLEGLSVDKEGLIYMGNYSPTRSTNASQDINTIGRLLDPWTPTDETELYYNDSDPMTHVNGHFFVHNDTANLIRQARQMSSHGTMSFVADKDNKRVLGIQKELNGSFSRWIHCSNPDMIVGVPNDIAVSWKTGRMYMTGQIYQTTTKPGDGQIWLCHPNGTSIQIQKQIQFGRTNGIAIDPCETHLYFTESYNKNGSIQNQIWKYSISQDSGLLLPTSATPFIRVPNGIKGGLDGIRFDTSGRLFAAVNGAGLVLVYSSGGQLLAKIKTTFPGSASLAFTKHSRLVMGGRCEAKARVGLGCVDTVDLSSFSNEGQEGADYAKLSHSWTDFQAMVEKLCMG